MQDQRITFTSRAKYGPKGKEDWAFPPDVPSLTSGEVHVWKARLDANANERVCHLLSDDELGRARRFRFDEDRQHFTCARGLLRVVLGYYTDADPRQVSLSYGLYGKPVLSAAFGSDGLRFNVSHSRDLALVAITRGREAGVDVEYVSPRAVDDSLTARFFSERESDAIRCVQKEDRAAAFFSCWTLKEAYLKARGDGLAVRLNEFEVSLTLGASAAIVSHTREPEEVSRWSLRTLSPAPGYRAALVVEGHGWQLSCWQVTEEMLCKWSPQGGAMQVEPS